jgi:ABC-type transport system substrate-binding protein
LREIISRLDGREMRFRRKRVVVLLVVICVVALSIHPLQEETQAIDPFFTLVAKAFLPTHLDILYMIKEQIARIGINLDVIGMQFPAFVQDPPDYTMFREFDLGILEFSNETNSMYFDSMRNDPYFSDLYSENGSIEILGYETSYDWDKDLGNGRNEWFIQNGKEMISNDSLNQKEICMEWQHYLIDDVLPCLPLFAHQNDSSSLQLLIFNLREIRPVIGSREACPGYVSKAKGLAVKKAICYAINREEIKRVLLGDDYMLTHHPVNPINKSWLNPEIFKYCHNLDVSRNYMTVTGYGLCGMPIEDGYGLWPDWEDVCSSIPTTIRVNGFALETAVSCLALCSSLYLYFKFIRRRKGER